MAQKGLSHDLLVSNAFPVVKKGNGGLNAFDQPHLRVDIIFKWRDRPTILSNIPDAENVGPPVERGAPRVP